MVVQVSLGSWAVVGISLGRREEVGDSVEEVSLLLLSRRDTCPDCRPQVLTRGGWGSEAQVSSNWNSFCRQPTVEKMTRVWRGGRRGREDGAGLRGGREGWSHNDSSLDIEVGALFGGGSTSRPRRLSLPLVRQFGPQVRVSDKGGENRRGMREGRGSRRPTRRGGWV